MALQDWKSTVVLDLNIMNSFREGDKDAQNKYEKVLGEAKRLGFIVTEVVTPEWKDIRLPDEKD